MLEGLFERLLGRSKGNAPSSAPAGAPRHLVFAEQPAVIYAIGDIHGCLDLLRQLETEIVADAEQFTGDRWIVVLGDFVDRGPSSAALVDHLAAPAPKGFRRLLLKGNHEAMMLDFLDRPRPGAGWLASGGRETLLSYGVPFEALAAARGARALRRLVESYVPDEHVALIASLPSLIETPRHLLVHAGLRLGVPTNAQVDADLLWYRDDFEETYSLLGKTVVHGHQVRDEPLVSEFRVGLDTGACLGRRLSAARLTPEGGVKLLGAERRSFAVDLS